MKAVRVVILVAVLLALVGTQTAWAASPGGCGKCVYTVKRGDTLYGIATARGTTVNRLVRCNNVCNRNCIYKGQRLVVPCKQAVSKACRAHYTARRGDTLSGIAYRYGTTVSALVYQNHIGNRSRIYVGQRLCIPKFRYTCGCCGGCCDP